MHDYSLPKPKPLTPEQVKWLANHDRLCQNGRLIGALERTASYVQVAIEAAEIHGRNGIPRLHVSLEKIDNAHFFLRKFIDKEIAKEGWLI